MGFYKSVYAVSEAVVNEIRTRPAAASRLLNDDVTESSSRFAYLDKAWHAIHWLRRGVGAGVRNSESG